VCVCDVCVSGVQSVCVCVCVCMSWVWTLCVCVVYLGYGVCEFEQALGVGDGQGGLACCSPWGRKELDMTEQRLSSNLKKSNLKGKLFGALYFHPRFLFCQLFLLKEYRHLYPRI